MSINFNELRELLAAIAQTDITELTLKSEDFELTVRKDIATPVPTTRTTVLPGAVIPPTPIPTPTPVSPPSEPSGTSTLSPLDKKWAAITSPMVGT
ncbi:MAG: acetyl-CoA carboxylase biotin carboxyl carrier protein, partial [Microcystaceae cyanobacterium]